MWDILSAVFVLTSRATTRRAPTFSPQEGVSHLLFNVPFLRRSCFHFSSFLFFPSSSADHPGRFREHFLFSAFLFKSSRFLSLLRLNHWWVRNFLFFVFCLSGFFFSPGSGGFCFHYYASTFVPDPSFTPSLSLHLVAHTYTHTQQKKKKTLYQWPSAVSGAAAL